MIGVPIQELLLFTFPVILSLITQGVCLEEWVAGVHTAGFGSSPKHDIKRVLAVDDLRDCHCPPSTLVCAGPGGGCLCIHRHQRCDGHWDCTYGEDEQRCAKAPCSDGFACQDGQCLLHEQVCDGVEQCSDGADERLCERREPNQHCTQPGQFNCSDGTYCITSKWLCDGDADCKDNSDEENCNECDHNLFFTCRDGTCIEWSWVCDSTKHCPDGSDENTCHSVSTPVCGTGERPCGLSGPCLKERFWCDGRNDCGDWLDEALCDNASYCAADHFRCGNKECIQNAWVCDGSADCLGAEDETNCTLPDHYPPHQVDDCPDDHLMCLTKCVPPEHLCDRKADCLLGEDEFGCSSFTCPPSSFRCNSTGACIELGQVCDGRQDCLRGEDERDCEPTSCSSLPCSESCGVNREGAARCLCRPGFSLARDNRTCMDVDECAEFEPCSQTCVNTPSSYKCSCAIGYRLRPDKSTCKAEGAHAQIIFATNQDIRQLSLDGQEYMPLAEELHNAIALDFHFRRDQLFWSDVLLSAIMVAHLNGTNSKAIVRWGLSKPTGLAVDWLNDHIYWLDSSTLRLEVSELDGANRTPLLWSGMDNPRALVAYPAKAMLFWTDWGNKARIERIYMDGSGRKAVIYENIFWPNGITIDYPTNTIYWVDAKKSTVECADLDGLERKTINVYPVAHPFGVTQFEDNLYWTDWQSSSIQSMNKKTGMNLQMLRTHIPFPMDIKVVHLARQPIPVHSERRGCSINNGRCTHLCLPGPASYSCHCPHGLLLQPDGRNCSSFPNQLLLFTQSNNIRMISLSNDTIAKAPLSTSPLHSEPFITPPKGGASTVERDNQDRHSDPNLMNNVVPVDSVRNALAIDFDDRHDMLYWTDVGAKTISRAHLNGSSQELIVQHNLEFPGGIAVDWLNDKVYWTDDGANRIEVANLDGSQRSLLVWQNLDRVRAIVVCPQEGLMFWTEWGEEPRIERAHMDGSNRTIIVSSDVRWLNDLAIDHDSRQLYWLDAWSRKIEVSDFNGKGRTTVVDHLTHPFGLAVFDAWLLWTDWGTSRITAVLKSNTDGRHVLVDSPPGNGRRKAPASSSFSERMQDMSRLMEVRVFHRNRPKLPHHACIGAPCTHICLLRPNGFTCACPTGIILQADGITCADRPEKEILLAQLNMIRSISLDTPYVVDVVLPLPHLHNVVAIAVDGQTGDLFVSDTGAGVIYRCSGHRCQRIITSALGRVEGITVDTTTRKLYWTDESRHSLEVSELNGTRRRVLFTDLGNPRGIVTHFPTGALFWSDWNEQNPRIEKSYMDGQNRTVLVDTDVAWPNCLTIDWERNELFWTDAKTNKIEALALDGSKRRTVLKYSVPHPYGIAVLDEWLYWTDWSDKSLQRALKASGERNSTVKRSMKAPMDVVTWPLPGTSLQSSCSRNNGHCSHLCLRTPQAHSCACPTGLVLKDGRSCSGEPTHYLVFGGKNYLGRISMDTKPFWDVGLEVPGIKHPVALDVHYKTQKLYYTDADKDAIFVVSLNNLSYPEVLLDTYINSPDGLAVDWIAENLYWTDAGRKCIEVVRLTRLSRKVLIDEDLQEPRAIAVFPSKGFLFWSDWGENASRIERSYLDGSHRTVIVNTNIGWPNGLALDYKSERLFWIDAQEKRLESCDLEGERRQVLVTDLPHPFGLALMNSFVYWTDWNRSSIEMADKIFGKPQAVIRTDIREPMEIVSIRSDLQEGSNSCGHENGGCTDLCLYRPEGGHVCACGDEPDPHCSTEKGGAKIAGVLDKDSESKGSLPSWLLLVLTVTLALILLLATVACCIRSRQQKMELSIAPPPIDGGSLTYTNPSYTASHSDMSCERRPFTWRRLHHPDNPQGRLFDEKAEVAALISEGSSVEHESPPPTPPKHSAS
ncbi:low-density lipoprotein receptor-related protein 4 [Hyalella azteca]|uniref:Low-density lipoprotein receptor-related protein 4 n=1 Tax=Hyalella azteca TaxID=294128 RepID=A0A8B7PL28_HYAAZ|nr:low-density lipoprotein receptor-related protein 4 [Hyalella azteca]